MTILEIAKKIPAEYRSEILLTNMISNAQPITGNASMDYLGVIWKNYIAPEENLDCGLCLMRILDHYRQLQPHFIDLEKESKLLDEV